LEIFKILINSAEKPKKYTQNDILDKVYLSIGE